MGRAMTGPRVEGGAAPTGLVVSTRPAPARTSPAAAAAALSSRPAPCQASSSTHDMWEYAARASPTLMNLRRPGPILSVATAKSSGPLTIRRTVRHGSVVPASARPVPHPLRACRRPRHRERCQSIRWTVARRLSELPPQRLVSKERGGELSAPPDPPAARRSPAEPGRALWIHPVDRDDWERQWGSRKRRTTAAGDSASPAASNWASTLTREMPSASAAAAQAAS